MRERLFIVGACAFLLAAGAMAQTAVTTSGGTVNTVPVFTGTASVGNSLMTIDGGGNVSAPGLINGEAGYSIPWVGTPGSWAKIGTFTAQQGESILIKADIHSGFNALNVQDSTYFISFKTSNGSSVDSNGFAGNSSWYAIGFNASIPPGNIKWVANAAGASATAYDLYINLPIWSIGSYYTVSLDRNASWVNHGILVSSDPGPASSTVLIPSAEFDLPYGNLGVGTNSPGARLEVNGNIKLTSGSGASITFADGTIQSTAWTGSLCGGDYAEAVDVSGERKQYEPGDVLVIDPSHPGNFLKSTEPYSRLVAGIYSTKPGLIGRRQTTTDPKLRAEEVPMAMVGIVPTKVTAENGPIEVGDLMVTSSQPGYAMKGTDGLMKTGTVIGKALGSLSSGTGVIEVLVSLQ